MMKDLFSLRKIERKEIETEADLERERWAHAPVLGKDAWYACFWYGIWRLITLHVCTPSGAWVAVTTPLAYNITEKALLTGQLPTGGWYTIMGFGAHTALAWIYFCERHGARNLISAMADWIRGAKQGQGSVTPTDGKV